MTKRKRPVAVKEALDGYLQRAGLKRRLEQVGVIPRWSALVGPQIAAVTEPERVSPDGTLFVRVASSAWMSELQLQSPTILAAVNGPRPGGGGGGGGPIKQIRWLLKTQKP